MSIKSESGRSMLEMIGVIALIVLLGMGALVGYQQTIASHQATTLHEDILVQAQSRKGQNYRGKTTYDSGIGQKTRTGLAMQTANNDDGETFSVIVKNVSSDMCKYLAKKDWKDAVRIKMDNNAYASNAIDCTPLKNSEKENFDLEVIFPKKASTLNVFQRTCDQCMSCERCDANRNICVNNCPSAGQTCVDNTCITRQPCDEGQEAHGNSCQDCSPNSVTPCSGCADRYATRPYWNGTQCVCYGDSCGAEYFCKTTGECDECPANADCPDGLIECIEGYYQSGESCLECVTDGSETCETCTDESTPYWDGETCVSAICPPNSSTTETSEQVGETGCYCVAGYIVNAAGNGCVAETPCSSDADCSQGYYCNPTTEKCAVNTCLSIPNSSPITNGTQIGTTGCYCKTGYIVNPTTQECVRLPIEYQEVEYIESNGNQIIDIGYTYSNVLDARMLIDFTCLLSGSAIFNSNGWSGSVFGGPNVAVSNSQKFSYTAGINDTSTGISAVSKRRYVHDLDIPNNYYKVIDTTNNSVVVNLQSLSKHSKAGSTYSGCIFGYVTTNGQRNGRAMRIYSAKFFDNGQLVRDFVPCYKKSNNEAGMFDLVEGIFYPNIGTGSFTKGSDVE